MIEVMTTMGECTFKDATHYLTVDETIRIMRPKTEEDGLDASPFIEMALFNLEYVIYVSMKSSDKTKAG